MFSKNIPYANGEQDLMGTIEAGKVADMVVIDRDIFNIPEDELKDVQALNTYCLLYTSFSRLLSWRGLLYSIWLTTACSTAR